MIRYDVVKLSGNENIERSSVLGKALKSDSDFVNLELDTSKLNGSELGIYNSFFGLFGDKCVGSINGVAACYSLARFSSGIELNESRLDLFYDEMSSGDKSIVDSFISLINDKK